MAKEKYEQNQKESHLSHGANTAITGFVGGLFWGFIGLIGHYFNFTELSPTLVLDPWTVGDWKKGWLGAVISLLILGLLGILAAFIYQFTLQKFQSIWVGMIYGALLFLLVFYVLNPLFPDLNTLTELSRNTIITTLCIYLLFGVFVGYSISYNHHEEQERKNEGNVERDAQKSG